MFSDESGADTIFPSAHEFLDDELGVIPYKHQRDFDFGQCVLFFVMRQ